MVSLVRRTSLRNSHDELMSLLVVFITKGVTPKALLRFLLKLPIPKLHAIFDVETQFINVSQSLPVPISRLSLDLSTPSKS